MKKLNLLEPALIKGYLNGGNGEQVSYLQIESELNKESLKADIDKGAIQFEECLQAAEKGLSRVVVIRATNEEEGLMAVNYLSGICNSENGYEEEDDDSVIDMSLELDTDDFIYDVEDFFEDQDEDDMEAWEESPWRVPVVPIYEIDRYNNDSQPIFNNNFVMAGMPNMRNHTPYWVSCTKEKICIMITGNFGIFGLNSLDGLTRRLNRFRKNEHVFVVIVNENEMILEDDDSYGYQDQEILQFLLENTADMIVVNAKEDKLKNYRLLQMENWLHVEDMRLEARFPKKKILNKILKIRNSNKSEVIKMVLRYVKKESQKAPGEKYREEDFAILSKFKVLGLEDNQEKEHAKRFETELVGMDKVKEQVKNIVQIMKYNKYRKDQGVANCNYHNVHLMIGAPGTAKTTVAKFMGDMMREENLLKGNRFACVNGADLKGMYVGHSAPKVQALFHQNDIILIDEAYSLVDENGNSDSFSQEALAQLILEIEEHGMEKLIMLAGYGGSRVSEKNNKMKRFIDANPGLKSRINSTIYFESYTPEQMVDIVHVQAKIQELNVDKKADSLIKEYFAARVTNPNFGNGREARSLLENALVFSAARIMSLPEEKRTKKVMNEVTYEDIEKAIDRLKNDNMMQAGKERGTCGFF